MKAKSLQDTTTLHNGVKMPWLGLGVFKVKEGQEVIDAVKWAIEANYRSIDTAAIYQNEEGVGEGIKQAGVSREELFITSKVWNANQGYESTLKAFDESLNKLGLDYLDLYLIHWPVAGKYKDTWKALEKLYKDKKVRAIGVSNFHVHHLEDLLSEAEIKPMVNQVEFHPKLTQEELRTYCKEQNIQMEAWSPLMQGKLLIDPVVEEVASNYGKSTAQILIRWGLEHEVVTIPKSIKKERIIQNAEVFDFEISKEDMEKLDGLNENKRIGPDPDNFDF
ncbi:diketogulonate reductase-like aldo/keto reductase [Salirhabdus euzebyi]|uniref:Diketogulonate reductase-like aldo/keto reductase n=1 Tax=Salirhabdus euzebyi TaxID=394506 RepID=A0A841Q5V0_9BACI|nr:aldo/keto reductase [Salirhabdus euzebyi]MBB6453778.1 diketogulonate reductase-like aldo/keto reductase [Salirhabdus euzebyi]